MPHCASSTCLPALDACVPGWLPHNSTVHRATTSNHHHRAPQALDTLLPLIDTVTCVHGPCCMQVSTTGSRQCMFFDTLQYAPPRHMQQNQTRAAEPRTATGRAWRQAPTSTASVVSTVATNRPRACREPQCNHSCTSCCMDTHTGRQHWQLQAMCLAGAAPPPPPPPPQVMLPADCQGKGDTVSAPNNTHALRCDCCRGVSRLAVASCRP
jgi:hypothetical protein